LRAARDRRVVILFLLLLTVLVMARAVSSARGATLDGPAPSRTGARDRAAATPRGTGPADPSVSIRLEESGDLLTGGGILYRTLALSGVRPWSGELEVAWEARVGGRADAAGRASVAARAGLTTRVILSIPLPEVHAPAGLDLEVQVSDAGRPVGGAVFTFTVYPDGIGRSIAGRLARARAALYDPEGTAGPSLLSLGLPAERVEEFREVALYQGDLIIIGPGGFSRGREDLGPILAARARSGMRVLILDQPTLPATLSEDLRLWPSFSRSPETSAVLAPAHPILAGLPAAGGAGYFAALPAGSRPLLPPTRGNFRVLAQVRVRRGPSWQEGVTLLEVPIGEGTVIAAQASLCSEYARDVRARVVLINTLAYLLGDPPRMPRTFLYAAGPEALPPCLARLDPRVPRVQGDLRAAEVVLVPGDWQAPRAGRAAGLPPIAAVSRFLREGGTVVLLNPQPLVLDYLRGITGANVYFEPADGSLLPAGGDPSSLPLLQGIAAEDLELLARPDRPELRLRAGAGADGIRPTLIVPGLARYRVGSGTLVALALPETDACGAPRTSSLLSRLLTNLGVPLDPGPPAGAEAITRLDD
jgi:hypothetical protein